MSPLALLFLIVAMFPLGYGLLLMLEVGLRKVAKTRESQDWVLFGGLFAWGALLEVLGPVELGDGAYAGALRHLETLRLTAATFGLLLGGINVLALLVRAIKARHKSIAGPDRNR